MEMLHSILSLLDRYKLVIAIFPSAIAAFWGLGLFYLKQKEERKKEHYARTLDYYQDLSCQLFSCMDKLCDREKLKDTFDDYQLLMCGAGKAVLVADPQTKDLITEFLQSIIKGEMHEKESECHEKATAIINSMNNHLRSYL